jgi:enediyne biosynthesis protein E4
MQVFIVTWCLAFAVAAGAATRSGSFTDVTESAGLAFTHANGRSGRKYFIEPLGSGVALLDYDGDADLDVYAVNGAALPGADYAVAPRNALFRNDGGGRFVDVTTTAGVGDTGYGLGCGVADYDGDGHVDIYVTNYGPNVLYRNRGDGTFEDVAHEAGVAGDALSASCAFLDADGDGLLDLYVVNYVQFDPATNPVCRSGDVVTYCTPKVLPGASDGLYRNRGDGTFEDVTQLSGIYLPDSKGLGVATGDLDNDGDTDIFVACDTTPDLFYRNDGTGVFEEHGLFAAIAISREALAYGGMGVATADFDNDGWVDVGVTNFQDQTNFMHRNVEGVYFQDVSLDTGVGAASLPMLGWGVEFADFDQDGRLDMFVANGHLDDNVRAYDPMGRYAQPDHLYLAQADGSFRLLDDAAITTPRSSRGAAAGDIDGDGDIDLIVTTLEGPLAVLRNDLHVGHRMTLSLVGRGPNTAAMGARVRLTAGGATQMREVHGGSGYLSQSDTQLHFGLGAATTVERIDITWPDGAVQTLRSTAVGQTLVVTQP